MLHLYQITGDSAASSVHNDGLVPRDLLAFTGQHDSSGESDSTVLECGHP